MTDKKITDKTLVPLGMVATLVAAIIGGVLWLTSIKSDADMLKAQLSALSQRQDEASTALKANNEFIQSVDSRLSRIEGRLGIDH